MKRSKRVSRGFGFKATDKEKMAVTLTNLTEKGKEKEEEPILEMSEVETPSKPRRIALFVEPSPFACVSPLIRPIN